MRALSIAATGMQAQSTNVEVIANNIANVSTTGFKRAKAEFQDLIYQSNARVGTASSEAGTILPTGTQIGLGVRNSGVNRITTQGSLTETGNKLDIAIDGRGYIGVTLPNGEVAYTRDGSMKLSREGQIVTTEGYPIEPNVQIDINAVEVTINQAGEIITTAPDGKQQTVGRLQLYVFPNEGGLDALGGNKFLATEASGDPVQGLPSDPGYGRIRQGYLEASNVNVVQEMTSLIQAQRAYEQNSKVIQAADEMLQTVSNIR